MCISGVQAGYPCYFTEWAFSSSWLQHIRRDREHLTFIYIRHSHHKLRLVSRRNWCKKGRTPVLVGELMSWRMLRLDWQLILAASRWGSRMSRYLETMRTEIKYTTAKARNWACLLSSCGEESQYGYATLYSDNLTSHNPLLLPEMVLSQEMHLP